MYGPDFATTVERLQWILDRLGTVGLKLKAKKCQLFQEKIPFLGHIVTASGVGADPAKCKQVKTWSVSRDLHEVRLFVGLCSNYRRHIRGFTELAAPLATKGTSFEWTKRRDKSFNELKAALTSAYVSKSLEGSEQRYCTARKELLAVVRALKHFRCSLYGQKITVRKDNSAASWLHRSKDPVGKPARWIEVIDTYDVKFQHRPSLKHGNTDTLSQYPHPKGSR